MNSEPTSAPPVLAETTTTPGAAPERIQRGLARLVLATFLFTFISARVLVIFIMAGKLPPELFFHVRGTHVHHLNYGILLLSATGAWLLFARPQGHFLSAAAILYGIGLALTFDEFGMWVHLGGPYWQRASYDAVVTVAAILALISYGASIRRWRPRHHVTIALLAIFLCVFGYLLYDSVRWAGNRIGPLVDQLEQNGPK